MACNFDSTQHDICEDDDCQATTDVTYRVEEKKKLCDKCASKGKHKIRRTHGRELICDKHGNDVDLYCKTHGLILCYSCAHIGHQQPCECIDIEDAIADRRSELTALLEKAHEKRKLCRSQENRINQCRTDVEEHLTGVKSKIDSVVDEVIQDDKVREDQDVAKINQEIDEKIRKLEEEIQKNKEEKQRRVEQAHIVAENRRRPVEMKQRSLHAHVDDIAEELKQKLDSLEISCEDAIKATEDTTATLDRVLKDDTSIIKDVHFVDASVADALQKLVDESGVEHISRSVLDVSFLEGAEKEKYNGRIDGGEWRLIDSIIVNLRSINIVGCIDGSHLIVTSEEKSRRTVAVSTRTLSLSGTTTRPTYRVDMNTQHTQRIIPGSETSWVSTCALLKDGRIVCGKQRKDSGNHWTACVSLYDREWNLLKDITLPGKVHSSTPLDVAADRDGMIIAAERCHSRICVIDPSDGSTVSNIKCKGKIVMLGVLSSGHIVARPSTADHRLFIVSRDGSQKDIRHSSVILNACIDPVTDALYAVTSDDECKTCVIDQVMSRGEVMNRRAVSFPLPRKLLVEDKILTSSRVMMTSSGTMIACDGERILLFKKLFRC